MESSDSDLGLIDITAFTELDSWDHGRTADFDITDFPEFPEEDLGTPVERVQDRSFVTGLDDESLDLIDVFQQGEMDGWESSAEFLDRDYVDVVPNVEPAKEDRFLEQASVPALEDEAMDIIDVFEQGELDAWEGLGDYRAGYVAEIPALGEGMTQEDQAAFEAFMAGLESAASSTMVPLAETSEPEVVVTPVGEIVVSPEGGLVVSPEGEVVVSPRREAVVVSPKGEVVVSPKVDRVPSPRAVSPRPLSPRRVVSPRPPSPKEELVVTTRAPRKPIPKRFRTKLPVLEAEVEIPVVPEPPVVIPLVPEPEEIVEVDWERFPTLKGEGEGFHPRFFYDEDLIDVGLETELDVWGEREDIFTFEPSEFEFLERAGSARTPVVAPVSLLPEGLLIPELESSLVYEPSPPRAVQLFRTRPGSGLDPLVEVEMGLRQQEHMEYMYEVEEAGDEGFKILLKYPDMSLERWFPVAAHHFRKLMNQRMSILELQMNTIREIVLMEYSTVLQDQLESVVKDAHKFVSREVEREIQIARASAQEEDMLGKMEDARLVVIDHFNEMLADFQMKFYTKLCDNFIRLLRWLYHLMVLDLKDTNEAIKAAKAYGEQEKFIFEHQESEFWYTNPLLRRQAEDFWRTCQRKSVRTALNRRASLLLRFLELRLDDVSYENIDFRQLWLAMRRAHKRVTELCYRATHKPDNRVNEYLGFDLTPIESDVWNYDREESELSYEDDTEDYSSGEEAYDLQLLGLRKEEKTRRVEREEELEELAVRFDYPPDIPLTVRPEPDFESEEFQERRTPEDVDCHILEEINYRLERKYHDLQSYHRRILARFPYLNQLLDKILKLRGKLGAYVNDLIPKWIEAEAEEAIRRKEHELSDEVKEAAYDLVANLEQQYIRAAELEACRLLLSLCDAMDEDLDMAEASDIYQNRIPSDKVLPKMLTDATNAVKSARARVNMAKIGDINIRRDFEKLFDGVVAAHRVVKKCLVMLIGKCDQTAMEVLLGYEIHKLSDLDLEARNVLTYHQMAKEEEESEAAMKEKLEKAQKELDRVDARERMIQGELEKENEAVEGAKESKNRLRMTVVREVIILKNKIRDADEFMDRIMDIMNLDYLPKAIQTPMEIWRSQAMKYIDGEGKTNLRNAYARQIKKKDKMLLKGEQHLLNLVHEKMAQIIQDHPKHIVNFVTEMRNKVKEQVKTVDTQDYDMHEAIMEMNTKVAYIEAYPWVAAEEFGAAWWAIEAAHKRMKELIFLEREQYGQTNLEKYLGNILVLGSEVALGSNPSEYVVEENLGVDAMHPLPPAPPKPEVVSLMPEQAPKKLSTREKREQERLAKQKAEEKRIQEEAEALARRRKKVKRKVDPVTAAILKEKAEAKARKDAEEREARKKAKDERDAKKAAVEAARKKKHAQLTEQAKKIRGLGKAAAERRGAEEEEEEEEPGRPGQPKQKRKVKILDLNALAKKIYDQKVRAISGLSTRLTNEQLSKLEFEAMREAEASITLEQRITMEGQRLKELDEESKKKVDKVKRAMQKEEKEKDLQEKIKRLKKMKEEEQKAKIEAAKEALKKKREAEEAAREKKPISEAALRRKQAAQLVSKPSASDRKPRKAIPKPKPKRKDIEEEEQKKKAEQEKEEALRAKREAVEKNLQRLREVEAFKKEQRRKKMLENDMGYPGLSSFGKNRSRQAKPPPVVPGCSHDHHHHHGAGDLPGGPLAGKHDSMLVLLRPTQSQYGFAGTEPHMYEPEPVVEREW